MLKTLVKNSTILLILNILAGVMNYFCQLIYTKNLDTHSFGILNVEITIFSLFLTSGLAVQYFAVLCSPNTRSKQIMLLASVVTLVASWITMLLELFSIIELSIKTTLFLGIPCLVLCHYWLGSLQGRKLFLYFGLSIFLIALIKFCWTIPVNQPVAFARAIAISGMIALPLILLMHFKYAELCEHTVNSTNISKDLILSLLPAFAIVLFPAYDLMNVRFYLNIDSAGQFSRLQTFSKILYFGPITLLQITLPYYVNSFKNSPEIHPSEANWKTVRKLEFAGLTLCYAGSFILAIAGPSIMRNFLSVPDIKTIDIFLACVSITPLYWLLSSVQIAAASKNILLCFLCVMAVTASPLLASFFKFSSLTDYLYFATAANTIFGLVGFMISRSILLNITKGSA